MELAAKPRARLGGFRCVPVFTADAFLHHESYPEKIACSFHLRGHEALVPEAEEITVGLLGAAYIPEPQ